MTTRFTDELMEQGLTQKVLCLINQVNLNAEFEKLQAARGLGNPVHRRAVRMDIKLMGSIGNLTEETFNRVSID